MFKLCVSSETKPRCAILGSFTLTAATQHRHEAQLVESLAASGYQVQAVGLVPGGFAQASLRDLQPVDRAIIFLRCFANTPRGQLKWQARFADWRRLSRLVGGSRRSLILFDRPWRSRSGLLQCLAATALKLRHPLRSRIRLNGPAPDRLLRCVGIGHVSILGHDAAQKRLFVRLQRAASCDLPLCQTLVDRAGATAAPDLMQELLGLSHLAAKLHRHLVRDALGKLALSPQQPVPPAIEAALEDLGGTPRLIRHLRCADRGAAPSLPLSATPCSQRLDDPNRKFLEFLTTGSSAVPGYAAWLSAPMAIGHSPLTRFEWLLALVLRLPIRDLASFGRPWASTDWRIQLGPLLPPDHPGLGRLATVRPAVTLHGETQSQTGLGLNLQMSRTALQMADIPVQLARTGDGAAPYGRLRRPIALHHLNADRIPQEVFSRYRFANTFHIGFPLWELDRLPEAHMLALDMLDEIWAPSVFVANVYRRQFRGKVMLMRKGLPALNPKPRLPKPGVTRFVVAFDEHSSVCRKNPLAALRAFQCAFGLRKDVELVIKTSPAPDDHWGDPEHQMAQIKRAAAIDPRIRLIRAHWPLNGLLGLVRGASALISPHRAEGFGYLPAFALSMGVPVIATDWSGPRDFCTDQTAFPVPFELKPVRDGQSIHRTPGARWADIDIGALAETMKTVAEDPAEAKARATLGQSRMTLDYSMAAQARRYSDRLSALGLLELPEPVDATTLDEMFAKCS